MRSVIAEYQSPYEARRAVHALEAHHSIQDIIITETARASGKNSVVVMSGERSAIEQARSFLAQRDRSTPPG